jgi:hypothetical protein
MMATMASQFSSMSNVSDAFLSRKMDINCETKNKVYFNNLKMTQDLHVISKELEQNLGLFWNCN